MCVGTYMYMTVYIQCGSYIDVYWEEFLKLQLLTCLQTRGIAVLLCGQP